MLLSLLDHARKQNWFMVVVEFLLVTLGVTLGVLASQWVEGLNRQASEDEYLQGLSGDFQTYQTLLVCRMENTDMVSGALRGLIEAIDDPAIDADTANAHVMALNRLNAATSGLRLEGNTNAILASDLVPVISDDELRWRLLASQSIASHASDTFEFLQESLLQIPRMDYYFERQYSEEYDFYAMVGVDLEGLRSDPAARDALINLHGIQRSGRALDQRLQNQVTGVLQRLVELGVRESAEPVESCPPIF